MKAPNENSNALSARDANGFVEGYGVSTEYTTKDDYVRCLFYGFDGFDGLYTSADSKSQEAILHML